MWGVPEVLDQVCREISHSILLVVRPDFHQVCPAYDVPLGPKLRYTILYSTAHGWESLQSPIRILNLRSVNAKPVRIYRNSVQFCQFLHANIVTTAVPCVHVLVCARGICMGDCHNVPILYRMFRAKFAHDEYRICNLQGQIYVVSTV